MKLKLQHIAPAAFIPDKLPPGAEQIFDGNLRKLLPLLQELKSVYLIWFQYYQILPKTHRHTLGQRVDTILIETIEAAATASFLVPMEKLPFVRLAIRKIDTIKILLMILWETDSLEDKKYIHLSEKLEPVGRMLGGWHGQLLNELKLNKTLPIRHGEQERNEVSCEAPRTTSRHPSRRRGG